MRPTPCVLLLAVSILARPASAQHDMHAMAGPASADEPSSDGSLLAVARLRQGSGTAWLPDVTPVRGTMWHRAGWMVMLHGQTFIYGARASSSRGASQIGSTDWVMVMASRPGAGGELTVRSMVSADRLTMGVCGAPNLIQSGAKCGASVRDLQHPHDLFMELAAVYRRPVASDLALEVYAAVAGEPALGPTAFGHRLSAFANPVAPVSHHWLDATHVSFGVLTGGIYTTAWKAEASLFNGRHGDDRRYGLDLAPLDSYAARVSWAPRPAWSLQVSGGRVVAPASHNHAAGATDVAVARTTASLSHHRRHGGRVWASTLAWGVNRRNGVSTGALVGETTWQRGVHIVFGRAEWLQQTPEDLKLASLGTETYPFTKLQAGYARPLRTWRGLELVAGASGAIARVPAGASFVYGRRAPVETGVFVLVRPAADTAH